MSHFLTRVRGFCTDSMCDRRPQPISGTLYIFKKMSADAQIQPSQDFIDELDEEWLYDS